LRGGRCGTEHRQETDAGCEHWGGQCGP
jgi:hypothetical protein